MPNSIKYLLFTLLGVVLTLGVVALPHLMKNIFGSSVVKTYEQDFEEMARARDIENVKVITNKNIVEITLNSEAFQKKKHKEIFGETKTKSPHYFINITSVDFFKEEFDKLQTELSPNNRIAYDIGQDADYAGVIFNWGTILIAIILGLLLIVPIYLLIFKLIKRL